MLLEPDRLVELISALGQRLQDRGDPYDLVVVGGGALLLLGAIRRPTEDLDVVARIEDGEYVSGRPLPDRLIDAVSEIARLYDVDADWLNPGPTDLHFTDLQALNPTREELDTAAAWATTHDTSEAFADQLQQALARLRGTDG